MRAIFFLFAAVLSISIPLLSAYIWFNIFGKIFPGFRGMVASIIGRNDSWRRDITLSSVQIIFYVVCLIAIPMAVALELMVAAPFFLLFGMDDPYILTLTVSSAGPIEELMKLFASIIVFIIMIRSMKKRSEGKERVRLGMVSGFFAGACFGFVESIGYIAPAFWEIIENGLTGELIDAVIWRAILGVSIHAIYTGLASGGLGRKNRRSILTITTQLLVISIIFHTLNNLVQGIFLLILDIDLTIAYMMTDLFQILLITILIFITYWVWKGKMFKEGVDEDESPPMRRGSKRLYGRQMH